MTQYRTYLDDSTQSGQNTISSILQNGSNYGIGISTNLNCNNLVVSGIATVGLGTTSAPSNSQLTFELTSNTNLRIKVRGTDGALRSANITLA